MHGAGQGSLRPRPVRRALAWTLASLILLSLAACAGPQPKPKPRCLPKIGMTTTELVACGCRLRDSGNLRAAALVRAQAHPGVQTIIVVNYLCPLGEDGIAMVSVVNGIADQVFD
jgi:hypothetical protein